MKRCLLLAVALATPSACRAEDWGNYAIVPVSAPKMVLEAVDAGKADGTVVSINKPAGKEHQKWSIVAKESGWFAIKPAHDPSLVLAVGQGATKQGSAILLEKDSGKASQLWSLTKRDNGAYVLTPKHAPELGLDLLGGKQDPGATVDLWALKPNDPHLQWFIRPLAAWDLVLTFRSTPGPFAREIVEFGLFAGGHLVITAGLCSLSVLALRRWWEPRSRRGKGAAVVSEYQKLPVHNPRRYFAKRPPVGRFPLLWKELHGEHKLSWQGPHPLATGLALAFAALTISWWPLSLIMHSLESGTFIALDMNLWAQLMGVVFSTLMFIGIIFFAAGTVSREREQQTLDGLRLVPSGDVAILGSKWLGAVGSMRLMGWVLVYTWGLSLLTGGLHPLALPCLLMAWAVTAGFLASLGLWFSVVSKSHLQANLRMLVSVLGLLAVGGLLKLPTPVLAYWLPPGLEEPLRLLQSVHWLPPEWLVDFTFWSRDIQGSASSPFFGNLAADAVGMSAYALAAGFLWYVSLRRFVAEKGPPAQAPISVAAAHAPDLVSESVAG